MNVGMDKIWDLHKLPESGLARHKGNVQSCKHIIPITNHDHHDETLSLVDFIHLLM
jgi:hypothetical protein